MSHLPCWVVRRGECLNTILGLDPGSRFAGFGILQAAGEKIQHLDHGTFVLGEHLPFAERLRVLGIELQKIYERYQPRFTVVEKIFLGKNADSAFRLGHARGVCLYQAALAGSEIVEYATRTAKKGVTGNGGACKETVQMILYAQLGLARDFKYDASDALALAFHHARNLSVAQNLRRHREVEA